MLNEVACRSTLVPSRAIKAPPQNLQSVEIGPARDRLGGSRQCALLFNALAMGPNPYILSYFFKSGRQSIHTQALSAKSLKGTYSIHFAYVNGDVIRPYLLRPFSSDLALHCHGDYCSREEKHRQPHRRRFLRMRPKR